MNLTKNNLNNSNDSKMPIFSAGGEKKKCKIISQLSQNFEYNSTPIGEDSVKQSYELDKIIVSENPRIIDPLKYDNAEDFLEALKFWWVDRMDYSEKTFVKRRNLLLSMYKHPVFPVDLLNLNPDQIDACIQFNKKSYSKDTARNGNDAIRNQLKALYMVAKAQGVDYSNWNIRMPKRGKPKHKIIPLPGIVYKIIHSKYSKDPYENALYGHLALHGFMVGPRIDSEFTILKLKDVHIDEGYLHFYQPKVDEWRLSELPKEIMSMPTRKSYKNWIDKWRPRVTNQYSGDYVYLTPAGKPFTKEGLRNQLNRRFKPIWPSFHPYCMRDWCAVARLIKTKVISDSFDFYDVYNWFEHSDISVTQYYTKDANKYYKMAPYDWIKAVLKSQGILGEENSLNSKNPENDLLSNEFSPVEVTKPPWVRLKKLQLIPLKN